MSASSGIPVSRRRLWFLFEEHGIAIHATPKVAATSIRNACLQAKGIQAKPVADKQREAFRFLRATEELPEDTRRIATVRHPVDRAISTWRDKCMGDGRMPQGMKEAGIHKGMDLDSYIRRLWVCRDVHTVPMSRLFPGSIPVVMYEHLDHMWEWMRSQVPDLPSLPVSNVSSHPRPPVPPRTEEALRDFYAEDIQLWYPNQ